MHFPIDDDNNSSSSRSNSGSGPLEFTWHRRHRGRTVAATKPQHVVMNTIVAVAVPPSFFNDNENNVWNQTLFTSAQSQLTSKVVPAGERIDYEEHSDADQYFFVYSGLGVLRLRHHFFDEQKRDFDDAKQEHVVQLEPMTTAVVPAGMSHQVEAITDLKLMSVYVPPQHPRGARQKTKESPVVVPTSAESTAHRHH